MRVYYVVTMVPAALQVTRNTLRANNMLDQLKEDWSAIDLLAVYTQVLYLLQPLSIPTHYQQMIPSCKHIHCYYTHCYSLSIDCIIVCLSVCQYNSSV